MWLDTDRQTHTLTHTHTYITIQTNTHAQQHRTPFYVVGWLTPEGCSNLCIYLFLLKMLLGADPSREGANILEFETFSEIFIFFEWWLGGLRIPFPC